MFDVLDLFVPSLAPTAGLTWVSRATAWGLADEATLCSGDLPFARLIPSGVRPASAASATSNLQSSWTGLTLAHEAREAAADEEHWQRYLTVLQSFLDAHVRWLLVAEADCDQHAIAQVELTAAEVVALLDEQRRWPKSSFTLRAARAAHRRD
jgi:hypothetical protein